MNRKQKIIVSITGIFIVLLALIGLTYSYFLTRITGNEEDKSISISTANLELVYGDGNNLVKVENIEPGDPITPKIFTVTNNGNEIVEGFNIYLENITNTLSRKSDLIYTISCKNITPEAQSESCDEFQIVPNEVTTNEADETEYVFPSVMSIIATDTLEPADEENKKPAEVHEYTITVTYKDLDLDQSEDMNKKVEARINIYDGKIKFLATEIMNNVLAETGTKYINPSEQDGTNYTIPAEQINNTNERILSYTFDDLGTSYYYRGSVEDNYVNFAGMCWRIVRINGDGSIKLILEDQFTICNDNVDSDGKGTEDYAYTGKWKIGQGTYGYDDYFIDVTGESQTILNYLEPVRAADESMIKAFYDFQTTKLANYTNKLKSGDWCLNDNAYLAPNVDVSTATPLIKEEKEALYLNKTPFYYDTYIRLYGNSTKSPTLKCNGTTLNEFVDVKNENDEQIINAAPMYVSALTADEIVYAGGTLKQNYNYYLVKSGIWGILSTYKFNGISEENLCVHYQGYLIDGYCTPDFRPSISLANDITVNTNLDTINYGYPGTINNPYVIN